MKVCPQCPDRGPQSLEAFGRKAGKVRSTCKACTNAAQARRDAGKTTASDAARETPQALAVLAGAAPFGTPLQRASAEALVAHGSIVAAAEALRMAPSTLRAHLSELERKAAGRGYAPGSDMTRPTPPGFHAKGTSTLYRGDGTIAAQWVINRKDQDDRLAALADAMQTLAEPFRGLADPVPAPEHTSADLLNAIPIGDPHFGMLAWALESGEDFDLSLAESGMYGAVDYLIERCPKADTCLIMPLGDFFHTDNSTNRTARSGHALDVDSRWSKILQVGIRTMRRCIDRALTRHRKVHVIVEIGNHDDHSAIMLAIALDLYYEREPRVTVDTSPAKIHYYRFGRNMIVTTHTDTIKPDKIAQVIAADQPQMWGECEHRFVYGGHVHHDQLKEVPGVIVETMRTLAPRDAYHAAAGYRAGRDLKLDTYHITDGRIGRSYVTVPVLRRAASVINAAKGAV